MRRRSTGMAGLSSSGSRDPAGYRRPRGTWRRLVAAVGAMVMVAGVLLVAAPTANAASQQTTASQLSGSAAQITKDYVIRYWGRWITWTQQQTIIRIHGTNTLIGPEDINPQFRAVNLINDDTIYAFGYVDVTHGPVVVTIPPNNLSYSVLVLDMCQEVVNVNMPKTPGAYLLVQEGWQGTVPA